jgi:hypothetical protein
LQEQVEQVVPAVVKAVLDFLQIHGEMIFGNASVVIEGGFKFQVQRVNDDATA